MIKDDIQAASALIRGAIEKVQGPLPPRFLVEFLLRHWRVYLTRVHGQHGAGSEQWRAAADTTDRLLWSVAPKTDAGQRNELLAAIKPLLADLRHGMAVAHLSEEAQAAFLDDLSTWHRALVNPAAAQEPGAFDGDITIDPASTFRIDARDPRYRQIMDMLDNASVEQIDL